MSFYSDPFQQFQQYGNQVAQQAYQQSMMQNQNEQLALQRAQQAWKEAMDRAGLTGMFEGQATVPFQFQTANTFGNWGTPTAGQQTLTAQQQEWQQAYQNSLAYGQYLAPGSTPQAGQQTQQAQMQAAQIAAQQAGLYGQAGAPGAGQQTLASQQQQFMQGLQNRQFGLAEQTQQQQTAQQYLQLLSQLRGPADWAKYQQVLGSTPGGLRDLTAAAMGQYVPGGGATTGYQPQAVSLQSMQQQIAGQPQGQGYQQAQAGYYPPQGYQQAPNAQEQLYAQAQGAMGQLPGQAGQQSQPQSGLYQPAQYQQQQPGSGTQQEAAGGGANTFGRLPAPNQIAAQSWKNLAPSQQQMLLGAYEGQGWDKNDVTALFNQSLPKYAANAPSAGTWRLAA